MKGNLMFDYFKPKPKFKMESVEEFKARGGKIKHVDFRQAYGKKLSGFYTSRDTYEQNKEQHPDQFKQHQERLKIVSEVKRKIASNDI